MTTKVPGLEKLHSICNTYFSHTEVGGWVEEDENEVMYIFNKNGSLFGYMPKEVYFELLNYKEEDQK